MVLTWQPCTWLQHCRVLRPNSACDVHAQHNHHVCKHCSLQQCNCVSLASCFLLQQGSSEAAKSPRPLTAPVRSSPPTHPATLAHLLSQPSEMPASWNTPPSPTSQATPPAPQDYAAAAADAAEDKAALQQLRDQQLHQQQLIQKLESDVSRYPVLLWEAYLHIFKCKYKCNAMQCPDGAMFSVDSEYRAICTAKHNRAGCHSWLLQQCFVFAKGWHSERINCDSSLLAMHVSHVLRSSMMTSLKKSSSSC